MYSDHKILQIIPAPDHLYDKFTSDEDTEIYYEKVMCLVLYEEENCQKTGMVQFVDTMTLDEDGCFNFCGDYTDYIGSEILPNENRLKFSVPIDDTDDSTDQS